MRHVTLGDLEVSRIGLGGMGMPAAYPGAGEDDAESIRTIHRALELGVNHLDTAGTEFRGRNGGQSPTLPKAPVLDGRVRKQDRPSVGERPLACNG
jgi:predicted aldo/keto reductase-like oxidoreductase